MPCSAEPARSWSDASLGRTPSEHAKLGCLRDVLFPLLQAVGVRDTVRELAYAGRADRCFQRGVERVEPRLAALEFSLERLALGIEPNQVARERNHLAGVGWIEEPQRIGARFAAVGRNRLLILDAPPELGLGLAHALDERLVTLDVGPEHPAAEEQHRNRAPAVACHVELVLHLGVDVLRNAFLPVARAEARGLDLQHAGAFVSDGLLLGVERRRLPRARLRAQEVAREPHLPAPLPPQLLPDHP